MAGKNRKAAQDYLLNFIEQLCPGGENRKIYEQAFSQMSDAEFDKLMQAYESGEARPCVYAPNFSKTSKLSLERNIALGKRMGHEFFEKIWVYPDDPQTPPYLTPVPYMVLELPVRRQAQILKKKMSVPVDNKSIDQLTGQPAGDSRAARISYPELQVMRGMGLDYSLLELIKYRGGDIKGFNAMNDAIARDGTVTMKSIEHLASGVESTKTLRVYLTAMHLKTIGL